MSRNDREGRAIREAAGLGLRELAGAIDVDVATRDEGRRPGGGSPTLHSDDECSPLAGPPDLDEAAAALRADIARRGVLVPVEADEEGNVLDATTASGSPTSWGSTPRQSSAET